MTDDLVAFLCARLDEDEAAIEQPETWTAFDENETTGTRRVDVDHSFERVVACTRAWRALHIARHDPARVLREVGAKRGVIEQYESIGNPPAGEIGPELSRAELGRVLRLLALPYADHPDYKERWRP